MHDELPSTNSYTLERASSADDDGLVVFAERQSAGRGRFTRDWHSPRGASVLLSCLIRLSDTAPAARRIVLWSALAVRQAIWDCCALDTDIKWPNDLVVSGRKLSGILIESRPVGGGQRAYVIGVGVNCLQHESHFPEGLRAQATSLDLACPQPVDRQAVARALIHELDAWMHRAMSMDGHTLRDHWLEHAVPLGHRLRLVSQDRTFVGRLIELDPDAGILVELEEGGRRLFDPHTTSFVRMD